MGDISDSLRQGVRMLLSDGNGGKQWVAPNMGKYPISHVDTFLNRYTSLSKVYRNPDEAILDSRDNARYMLNNVGIRECLDARRRMVKLLNWHIEPEDSKSDDQKAFCSLLEKIIKRIKYFQEYRYWTQMAIWFGKVGIQHRWRADVIEGRSVWMPKGVHQDDDGWKPVHGDKIVFRQLRPNMVPGAYEGQMGIRVGWMSHQAGDVINNRWRVESTDYGLAYFLSPSERRLMLVHKHHREDAAYEDGIRAGSIYGLGIRSIIYAEWLQASETMAFMMEYLERMAGGITIWKYPAGNQQALAEITQTAENYNSGQEHALLVPVPIGENGNQYGVEVMEPGFQGIEVLQNLIKDYFNDRVKRYILGQKLSSEAEATGMGSGVADLHMDTLLQIIKSDATSHDETMTSELVDTIIKVNVDKKQWAQPGFKPRFVSETEEPDVDKKLEACIALMHEKIKFRQSDLYDLVGMATPGPDDLVNPDMPEAGAGQNGAMPGMEGMHPENKKPPNPDAEPGTKGDPNVKEPKDVTDDNAAHSVAEGHVERYTKTIENRYNGRAMTKPAGWTRNGKTGNKP